MSNLRKVQPLSSSKIKLDLSSEDVFHKGRSDLSVFHKGRSGIFFNYNRKHFKNVQVAGG